MKKIDIAHAVHAAHGGISFVKAEDIVDRVLSIIKQRLANGEKVLISGFGSFRVVRRKDKKGVNPQTGAPLTIAARNTIVFKPSKYLKTI